MKIVKQQFLPCTSSLPPTSFSNHCTCRSTVVEILIHWVNCNLHLQKEVTNVLGALGNWCLASISKYLWRSSLQAYRELPAPSLCWCSLFPFTGTAVPAAFSWGSMGSSCSKSKTWSRYSLMLSVCVCITCFVPFFFPHLRRGRLQTICCHTVCLLCDP